SDDGVSPHAHERASVEAQKSNPAAFRLPQTTGRDQNVEMGIECQMSAKGVRHHHNNQANPVFGLRPLLYHPCAKNGKVLEQIAVLLKDRPENIWHCKHHADVWDVGKDAPHLSLP